MSVVLVESDRSAVFLAASPAAPAPPARPVARGRRPDAGDGLEQLELPALRRRRRADREGGQGARQHRPRRSTATTTSTSTTTGTSARARRGRPSTGTAAGSSTARSSRASVARTASRRVAAYVHHLGLKFGIYETAGHLQAGGGAEHADPGHPLHRRPDRHQPAAEQLRLRRHGPHQLLQARGSGLHGLGRQAARRLGRRLHQARRNHRPEQG